MNTVPPPAKPAELFSESTQPLLDEFALAQAAELARSEDYSRAESVLRPQLERTSPRAAALDLQARICAQQGRLVEAGRWWQKVLDQQPGDPGATAALARLQSMQRRPVWLQIAWPLWIALGLVAGLAFLLAWQSRSLSAAHLALEERLSQALRTEARSARQQAQESAAQLQNQLRQLAQAGTPARPGTAAEPARDPDTRQQFPEFQAQVRRLADGQTAVAAAVSNQSAALLLAVQQELAAMKAELARAAQTASVSASNQATPSSATSTELALREQLDQQRRERQKLQQTIDDLSARHTNLLARSATSARPPTVLAPLPGAITSVSNGVVWVKFTDGLFDHGSHFRPDARTRLSAVLEILVRPSDALVIDVIGYADGDMGFLGPLDPTDLGWRRAMAVATKIQKLLRSTRVRAAAGISDRLPFPATTESERQRNRTVVLRITRATASGSGTEAEPPTPNLATP